MQPEVYIPLLSAFVGAMIGTVGTVSAVWIQGRREDRRHRREMAVRIASEQQSMHLQQAKNNGGGYVMPIDLYLIHAISLMGALEKKGKLTKEVLKKINDELDVVAQFLNERAETRVAAEPTSKTQ